MSIYTIGYAALTPDRLAAIMATLEITMLIDCRSIPSSRRLGFSRAALEKRFGSVYVWAGSELGGRGPSPTEDGLAWLARISVAERILLLCLTLAVVDLSVPQSC